MRLGKERVSRFALGRYLRLTVVLPLREYRCRGGASVAGDFLAEESKIVEYSGRAFIRKAGTFDLRYSGAEWAKHNLRNMDKKFGTQADESKGGTLNSGCAVGNTDVAAGKLDNATSDQSFPHDLFIML